MKQVKTISVRELQNLAESMYGDIVKAVVDIDKKIMVIDAEMHVDEEQYLLENGSLQNSLWGINIHPAKYGTNDFIEFDSMINIRPRQQNMSRNVENLNIQNQIIEIVNGIVTK
ncbi:MAG: DUF5674 family protein [Patescibacteria group bacterium]|jgi:hypothetical protein|nr:DUF5674 family protein [Patescibacteria group bacterium]